MLSFSKQVIQDTNTYERAGSIVRRLAENEIALTLYTDGGQLTVSTSIVVWPIILWLNELPGKVRQSFKNAVWVSLWFALFVSRARTFISVNYYSNICLRVSSRKPVWNVLFNSIRPVLEFLMHDGIEINGNTFKASIPSYLSCQ